MAALQKRIVHVYIVLIWFSGKVTLQLCRFLPGHLFQGARGTYILPLEGRAKKYHVLGMY